MEKELKNLMLEMLDIEKLKQMIAKCPEDEIVIICPHWSINKPKYPEGADPEQADWDWEEVERLIDQRLSVNDYDDLICDPHGIII